MSDDLLWTDKEKDEFNGALGKAFGWENPSVETPRTNAAVDRHVALRDEGWRDSHKAEWVRVHHARQLERDLNETRDRAEKAEAALETMRGDSQKYHRLMALLFDTQLNHGACHPRERRACTACNASEEIIKLIAAYAGPPIARSADGGADEKP